MTAVTELVRSCPWRPPDWRWLRASLLASGELKRNRQIDDAYVVNLARFAKLAPNAETPGDMSAIALRLPDVYWAYRLYSQEDPMRRAELEARVIGGESDEVIAVKMDYTLGMVRNYINGFYDVRDKLNKPNSDTYVLHTLIGPMLHRGMVEREYPTVWKYLAYVGGIAVFESYMGQSLKTDKPTDATGIRAWYKDASRDAMARKKMIAATTVPVNQFTQLQLLDVAAKFEEVDKDANPAAATESVAATLQVVFENMPLDIGQFAQPRIYSDEMNSYDSSAAELPTRHLILAAQNRLTEVEEIPQDLAYPESTHARTEQAG